ncbi:McrC family protein [Texcoconibacillus texcoconensis]|uniref:5-methylcytosine-specific restriction enzyme subunit McrC n=1 Tax=Texcoconibacillus texcoconensis TaxID=1095777 RepID=A0A840QM66_9BACI|nr:McrC family protein [Texcoconibacillus texcoconensis]MBB5172446.1 5-methylcytosine-specific restriction enzyme subunit McrC [Texcoconibacillus texcoconensis]
MEWLTLKEYEAQFFSINTITTEMGERIWENYGSKVTVEFPSPKTNEHWLLKSQGWVGYIPINPDMGLYLAPKVSLSNIFRMLEYAYELKSFQFLEGWMECETLQEFYDRLAYLLSQKIQQRLKKGIYHEYQQQVDRLPYVRGKWNVHDMLRRPLDTGVVCEFDEHLSDIEDNQILLWSLKKIRQSELCSEHVQKHIGRAYRALQSQVSLVPLAANKCRNRSYNRMNVDYQPLHVLCQLFLEHMGPHHQTGEQRMLPFIVNMAQLFERFVAQFLSEYLPEKYELKVQERVPIGERSSLYMDIDLVIYDVATGEVKWVIDTKYKTAKLPSQQDIYQAVSYATSKHCAEAILVYPTKHIQSFDEQIGDIRVRSVCFDLEGILEETGQQLLRMIFDSHENEQPMTF